MASLGLGAAGGAARSASKSSWSFFSKESATVKEVEGTKEIASKENWGDYSPNRSLPRDSRTGMPAPDSDLAHTQLGTKNSRSGSNYTQAREWGYNSKGELVPNKDIDFTDHGRSNLHSNPHQHEYLENTTGGTLRRSKKAEELSVDADNVYHEPNSINNNLFNH